jgi:hypothetical protein
MNFFSKIKSVLFGGSDKGLVEQANEVVERWKPSVAKTHEMNIEAVKVEEASQTSARQYEPSRSAYSGVFIIDLFNTVVDCANRLPRPMLAIWALCILFGVLPEPKHLEHLHPMTLNIIWTVIGFFFGVRTISQDIPKMIQIIRNK